MTNLLVGVMADGIVIAGFHEVAVPYLGLQGTHGGKSMGGGLQRAYVSDMVVIHAQSLR